MQLAMIGLGRMGGNMVRRLMAAGHEVIVYSATAKTRETFAKETGAVAASSLAEMAARLKPPRVVWLMVPAASVDNTLGELAGMVQKGDILIDGGNSYYIDDIRRAKELAPTGIHYVDCGTSGGVWGLERGYCLMIGGEEAVVKYLDPVFAALAPGLDAASRLPGREKLGGTAEHGYLYCGPSGAGHFVKMVHNGIEYGIMAAYAEGFNILHHANVGNYQQTVDAETTPLRNPGEYQYDLNLRDIAEVWRRGRPDGERPAHGPGSLRVLWASVGFGRGALDDQGRRRRGGAGAGPHYGAIPALQLPRRGRLCGQAPLRHALPVRRASGEASREDPTLTG
ncbi:MAG: gnd [Deltaproteobacteria bacterium]|nr:gnd [Deltaproteobacteria bacterium]